MGLDIPGIATLSPSLYPFKDTDTGRVNTPTADENLILLELSLILKPYLSLRKSFSKFKFEKITTLNFPEVISADFGFLTSNVIFGVRSYPR
ncbi:hypothetical protein B738_24975 [Photorhabdus temperata subsp. temperata M1021]|nr:hypothetical protein B738_24975 [Photorhabdus temperata subsp. temperata M1021]